jgi:phosphatidylglycerophosphate synthase
VEGFKDMTSVKGAVHLRRNNGLTAAAEKRLLEGIAKRLPGTINSDHLSALGLAAMAAAGASFAAMPYWRGAAVAVLVALAANWAGDSLDGTLARVRGHLRPRYGYYLDHVLDLAGATLLFAGLSCSGIMTPLVAAAVLVTYLLVCAETYLTTHANGVFRMSFLFVGPTELRLVLAAGTIKAAAAPAVTVFGYPMLLFDIGGIVAIAGMTCAFVAAALRNTRALYAEEPLPARHRSGAA